MIGFVIVLVVGGNAALVLFLLALAGLHDRTDQRPVDGRVDELAARRALRSPGLVENVVPIRSRRPVCGEFDRDGSAA